jgi:hypothetical protein
MNRRFSAGEPGYRLDLETTSGYIPDSGGIHTSEDVPAPLLSDKAYGPTHEPAYDWFLQNKWWVIGGGVGLFLLAGGSILGLSLSKMGRYHRRRR